MKQIKKSLSIVLALLMLVSLFAVAPITASAEISGDYEYVILGEDTAEITRYNGSDTDLEIPSEIDGHTVTSIDMDAFCDCKSLTSVTIPSGIISIGVNAFGNCESLTSVTLEDGLTSIRAWVFSNCTSLTNVTIPSSVTSIDDYAFTDCTSLTSITIPSSVTFIGEGAFEDCTSLTNITIPDSVTSIGRDAFNNTAWYDNQPDGIVYAGKHAYKYKGECPETVTLKDDTIGICAYAFYCCSSLKSITIPSSVTSIGDEAFYECTSLTSIDVDSNNENYSSIDGNLYNKDQTTLIQYAIGKTDTSFTIPSSVTSIGRCAFDHCTSLTSVTIPGSVTDIGAMAFNCCKSLASVTLEDGLTSIDVGAFSWCESLTSITIPGSVKYIGDNAFEDCTGLTSVTLEDGLTSIDNYAFYSCPSLTSVTIPSSVTSIGDYAFYWCESLTSITIPDSVTNIGEGAFKDCTSLTSITIPSSVTDIGEYAFGYYYDDETSDVCKIDGFKITGYSDTKAEIYAKDNGFEFISLDEAPTEPTEPTTESTEPTEASSETEPVPTESTEAPTLPAEGTFHVVAGAPELCNGVNWDPASPLNLMTLGEDEVYSITYTNVPAGTYKFKVTTNGAWDIADYNLVGDAKFGGPDAEITVTEDNSTVVISLKESDMHANAYINGVLVDMGATEPTKPAETEPTQPTDPACAHNETKTDGAKAATYFEKGYTGDVVCADCGEVIEAGKPIAVKKLKTPKVTVKGAKKAIKVTYKKVKDAKGFTVTYKLGKKTYTKKFTLSKKELKKAKVTKTIKVKKSGKYKVTVKAFVTSGKKIAYSKATGSKTAKVK